MTQLEAARAGKITEAMEQVAEKEKIAVQEVCQGVARGEIVIPANVRHENIQPAGVGKGLRVKVNANIGTSTAYPELAPELEKLAAALEAGADSVMDLSTGGDLPAIRQEIIARCPVMLGTVPVYQAWVEAARRGGHILDMSEDELFAVIEEHARSGVDFITVHCGVTSQVIRTLKEQGRVTDIVSRGGSFMAAWVLHHGRENPLYSQFDRLLEICRQYDVTLSLGDGLRPGALADATDRAQVAELLVLGELVDRARRAGVQVMVEGPGHVPLHQVAANIQLQKSLCQGAPFYVLGPLVTDVAPGYDHITSAIGGALAAWAGADFLCYVTPAEHLGLPTVEDVRAGVIAARIAGHAADIARGLPGALEWDRAMAQARRALDWEEQLRLAIDPVRARQVREQRNQAGAQACSMCGDFCAMQLVADYLGKDFMPC
ncbi:MAG: phosphomethylpyrimidine synthase ThiC [Desulfurispora sp.]|uniref:phosphomethylpyrimidine synthase ThiC n=1 Tax=Desulfurispora sp. TaxID=3014275 RepID=UPI00404A75B1